MYISCVISIGEFLAFSAAALTASITRGSSAATSDVDTPATSPFPKKEINALVRVQYKI